MGRAEEADTSNETNALGDSYRIEERQDRMPVTHTSYVTYSAIPTTTQNMQVHAATAIRERSFCLSPQKFIFPGNERDCVKLRSGQR